MQIMAYLNGDGPEMGKYLSVFLVILRGYYDEILPWPFARKITFAVMDQTGQGKDRRESFTPVGTDTACLEKPVGFNNTPMGCGRFMPLQILNDETYVKNDTLYLKTVIEMKGLRHRT